MTDEYNLIIICRRNGTSIVTAKQANKVSNPTVRITYLLDDHNTTLEHQQAVQQSNSTHYLLNDHNTTLEHQQAVIAQNSY